MNLAGILWTLTSGVFILYYMGITIQEVSPNKSYLVSVAGFLLIIHIMICIYENFVKKVEAYKCRKEQSNEGDNE